MQDDISCFDQKETPPSFTTKKQTIIDLKGEGGVENLENIP